jgi:tetratricopeptide (TPR) repeat protein
MTDRPLPEPIYQRVVAVSGFAYGAVGADIHVFGDGSPVYLLRRRVRPGARDSKWLRAQPSRMLDFRAETVEFTGRETELDLLRSWMNSSPAFSVRWLHGAGGQGKSRLAARLADEFGESGLLVVDAVHAADTYPPAEGSQDLRIGDRPGLLVVVDYADRWPVADLAWLFHNRIMRQQIPVRVLLLARSVEPWPPVRAKLHRLAEYVDVSDQYLAPLPSPGPESAALFRAARDGFARHYPSVPGQAEITPPAEFGLTLAILMSALVAVDARHRGHETPRDLLGLTMYLLDREYENWEELSRDEDAVDARTMRRLAFCATLAGPMRRDRATELLACLPFRGPPDVLIDQHLRSFPAGVGDAGNVLQPMLPDLLAEEFVALSLPGSAVSGYPVDIWSFTAASDLLNRIAGAAPPYTPRALAVLTSAARRWPHVGDELLFPLLRRDPGLVIDGGGAALANLVEIDRLDADVLESLGWQVYEHGHLETVADAAADFTERWVMEREVPGGDPDPAAFHQLARGIGAARAGRHSEALRALGEGVDGYRQCYAADPSQRRHLASALDKLGSVEAITHEHDRAALAFRESAALYRTGCDQGEPERELLAFALGAYALALVRRGRTDEAQVAIRESGDHHRTALASDPAPDRLSILVATDILCAEALRGAGAPLAAAARADRAVASLTSGSCPRADVLLPEALLSKSRISNWLHQIEEAVEAARRAAELYRELTGVRTFNRLRYVEALQQWHDVARFTDRRDEVRASLDELKTQALRLADEYRDSAPWPLQKALDAEQHGRFRLAREWGDPTDIAAAAERQARHGNWAAVWELATSAPLADAVLVTRLIPLDRWRPEGDEAAWLAARLAAADPRRVGDAIARFADEAVIHIAAVEHPSDVSFARPEPVAVFSVRSGGGRERLVQRDLTGTAETELYRGSARHTALASLGPGHLMAIRGDPDGPALVRYRDGRAEVLARRPELGTARLLTTRDGVVVVLGQRAGLLLCGDRGVTEHGPGGTPAAVAPGGRRLAFADGRGITVTDAVRATREAYELHPEYLGDVGDLTFISDSELITAGAAGGLARWEIVGGHLIRVANADTAPLTDLFAVPSWRLAGGWSPAGERHTLLDSVFLRTAPATTRLPGPGPLRVVTTSADGRYLLWSGRLTTGAGWRGQRPRPVTRIIDLRHPGTALRRPLASLTAADVRGLDAVAATGSRREIVATAVAVARWRMGSGVG